MTAFFVFIIISVAGRLRPPTEQRTVILLQLYTIPRKDWFAPQCFTLNYVVGLLLANMDNL